MSLVVSFGLAALAIGLNYLALNDLGDRDFLIWDHPATRNFDMWNMAKDYRDEVKREILDKERTEDLPLRRKKDEEFYILYEAQEGGSQYGCLDKEVLLNAKKLEKYIKDREEWPLICYAQSDIDPSCNQQQSFVSPLSVFPDLET